MKNDICTKLRGVKKYIIKTRHYNKRNLFKERKNTATVADLREHC